MAARALILLGTVGSILCYEAKGPPRADKSEVKHIAKVGDEVKLLCPVHGHPAPMVTWSKDGEVINFAWNRFRVSKRQMKIKGVIKEDTGVYLCKAINGFGSVEIKVELIVIRPEEMTGVSAENINKLSSPRFSPSSLESEKSLVRSVGSELVLQCSVSGYPAPSIQWYKDDQLYQSKGDQLVIRSLQTRDSGAFSCVARNMIGTSALTFTLNVRAGAGLAAPEPNMMGPANISVEQGDTARLDCRVNTRTKPNIKWLKKLESGDLRRSEVINVGSDYYRLIESSSLVVNTPTGDYLSQLVVEKAGREDEGMYICFVTSFNGGFNFKPSYLTVVQKSDTGSGGPLDFTLLILIICISIVTTLLIIGTVACLVQKKNKAPPSSPETVTVEVSPDKPIFKRQMSGGYDTPSFGVTSSRLEDLLTQSTPLNSPDTSQDQQHYFVSQAYHDFNDHFNNFNDPYSLQHNIYEVPSLQRHPHQPHQSHQPPQHYPHYGYYETARLNNSFNSSYSSRR